MLSEIVPKVKKTIQLAAKCAAEYEKTHPANALGFVDSFDVEDLQDNEFEKALTDYLYSLPYEDIEAIEAIMLLGREKKYNNKLSPEEILKKEIHTLRLSMGDGDKGMAIDYISEKAPLAKYLEDGLKILKQI